MRRLLLILLLLPLPARAVDLPGGFEHIEVLNGLQDPATMAFAPDGRLFIGERITGNIRVAKYNPGPGNWSLNPTPFASFSVPPARHRSAGVRGFAFDPNFGANGFLYVFYMTDSPRHNRVVRVQANPASPDVALPGETLLMQLPFNTSGSSGSHNGGAVGFGGDGKLYFTTGDGWNAWDSFGAGDNVQSLSTYTGKCFRLNPDGSIPTDNPFFATATGDFRAIYALGLRNPYSMSRHPVTGQLYINEVNGTDKSQMLELAAGANYGHDGFGGIGTSAGAWANGGDRIISGGAWYPAGGPFPATWHGRCFIALWNSDAIRTIASNTDTTREDFAGSVSPTGLGPVYTAIGNDGYLYYLNATYETGNGTVSLIRPVNGGSGPTVTVQTLDASASEFGTDPGSFRFTRSNEGIGDPLTVQYNLTGSAMPNDYTGAPGSIDFAANQSVIDLVITPVDDAITEAGEELVLTVLNNGAYTVGNPFSAFLTIADDDLPLRNPDQPAGTETGADVLYFEAAGLTSVDGLAALVPDSGSVATALDLSPAARSDDFGLRFLGYFDIPADGVYAFHLESDAGSVLRIGGTVIVTNDGVHNATEVTGLAGLKAGLHQFELAYFETTGPELMNLEVEGPGLARQVLPASWLRRAVDASAYGMDSRPSMGAYLNGVFPDLASGSLPATLSATGAFSDVPGLVPAAGLIPYDVNSPLWSDRAIKSRWAALPDGSTVDFQLNTAWTFPIGSVLIKHFEIEADENQAGQTFPLETRFMVKGSAGWYGITYQWRDDGTEADLLPGSATRSFAVKQRDGSTLQQTWSFPDRNQCAECHNTQAGPALGLNTRQMNRPLSYPGGVTDNQLRTWAHLGLFTGFFHEGSVPGYPQLAAVDDSSASLEHRVRSYLDVNCALCHQPGGNGQNPADMRFLTPLPQQGLVGGELVDPPAIQGAKLVAPGDADRSMLLLRMHSNLASQRMPPLARSVPHRAALDAVYAWIDSLPPDDSLSGDGLEAAWTMEDGTGVTANDVTGNNHHATLTNMPANPWNTENAPNRGSGFSLAFDGVNDYAQAGTFSVNGNALTLLAWIKADTFTHLPNRDGRILSKATGTATDEHWWMLSTLLSGGDTRLRFRIRTLGTTATLIASSGDLQPGAWIHVAAVYDGTEMRLYQDGVLVGSQAQSGAINTDNNVPVWIGGNPAVATDRPFDGLIDEVRVYARALSLAELVAHRDGLDAVNPDSDADTLPDAWEVLHFGNLAQGNIDSDGDRLLNREEWEAGLSPGDALARGDIRVGPSGVAFTARAASGISYAGRERHYRLLSTATLNGTPTWLPVPGYEDLTGDDTEIIFPIPSPDDLKFYRIESWLESTP